MTELARHLDDLGAALAFPPTPDLAAQFSKRAFDLRERVTERERLYISARYYVDVLDDGEVVVVLGEVGAVGSIDAAAEGLAVGIVQGRIEGAADHQERQNQNRPPRPLHRFDPVSSAPRNLI